MSSSAGSPAHTPSPEQLSAGRLFTEQSRELWAMFYSWCGDPERAWDAVQQAFLKYQEHAGPAIQDPRSWLLLVGKNWLRDVARRRETSWRAPQQERFDHVAGTEASAAEILDRADARAKIRRVMGNLRADDREVLIMRYALGWSSQRMAEMLDSSAAAIDMRLSRARQRLAVQLTAAGIAADSLD